MKIHELLEARKNPELNPKTSINDSIEEYAKKTGLKNSFISFTKLDKLGIFPGSTYQTPLGIYAYPLGYAWGKMDDGQAATRLPFAGDQPYATLFKAGPAKIIDLDTFSLSDLDKIVERLKTRYPNDHAEIDKSLSWAKTNATVKTPGGLLWALTMMYSGMRASETQNRAVKWNALFRSIDIDGVVDSAGDGIIHLNERTQAVFFKKPGVITKEKRIYNKYSPSLVSHKQGIGRTIKATQALIDDLMQKHRGSHIAVFDALRKGTAENRRSMQMLPRSFINAISVDDVFEMFGGDDDRDDIHKIIEFTKYIRCKRWVPGEPLFLQNALSESVDLAQEYCVRNMNRARWGELEEIILGNNDGYDIIEYAEDIIRGRWLLAEPQLRLQDRYWKRYCAVFNIEEAT